MQFYENIEEMRKVFIEKNNIHAASIPAKPGSWTAYKLSNEKKLRNEHIQNMSIDELHDMCLYYNIANNNHDFFIKHPGICEKYSQGTLDPAFVAKQKEKHQIEYLPYTYVEIPTVVRVNALSKAGHRNFFAVLSDPYGSLCARIKEDINPLHYIGHYILANMCYSSITKPCINRTRILDKEEDLPF